jgi:hypothetical protein
MTTTKVYAGIVAVQAELCKDGIGKDRKNTQQGFMFRGIDDLYNALAPILAKNQLCVLPRMTGRTMTERQAKSGGALYDVVVEAEFDIVSAEDGSKHTIKTFGEAMDSADKATNKAMSAAYKYAAIQAFCIPTEGDNDADSSSPEPAGRAAKSNGNGSSNGNGNGSHGKTNGKTEEPAGDKKPPLVTKAQIEELKSLCSRKGKTIAALLKRFNIDSLAKLTLSQYGICKSGFSKLPDASGDASEGPPADEAEV